MHSKLSLNLAYLRTLLLIINVALLSCRVISSDINKDDKHLSWSCRRWNRCDLISKDIFQPIAGNERASFLTNEEGRNSGSSPWGAIIIEARFSCCTCGGKTLAVWHIWLVMWRPHCLAERTQRKPWESTRSAHQIQPKTLGEKQVEHTRPSSLTCHCQTSAAADMWTKI